MKHKWAWLPVLAIATFVEAAPPGEVKPEHAVIFIIDGLSHKAPARLPLKNLQALAARGSYFEKSYTILPAHPVAGEWARHHSCSIPNPVIYAGTFLLRPDQRFVQQSFFGRWATANVVNDGAYPSLNTGYNLTFERGGKSDDVALSWATEFLRKERPRFMRVHLQQTGSAGFSCFVATDASLAWRRNIWGEGSPYVKAALNADKLLGEFLDELKRLGIAEKTLLFVTADHGESDRGWHTFQDEDGWAMPLVMAGPGIKQGAKFEYSEQIDIVPTLCHLMGVKPPPNADGVVLAEALENPPAGAAARKCRVPEFNRLLLEGTGQIASVRERAKTESHLMMALREAEERFQDTDRILDWHTFGSLEKLMENNRRALTRLMKATQQ